MTDITLSDHGSICILTPQSEAASDHLSERMPEDVQMWGGGYVIEPRYVDDILDDLAEHGFEIEGE